MNPDNFPKLGKYSSQMPGFQVMAKPRGALCNLNCQYCYYLEKKDLYPGSSLRMSDTVLETYIRAYIECQSTPEVVFAWQGGEPTLMGLDFYAKALELQQKYRKPGISILNSLQTNGILINDQWAKFLKQNNFLVGISLDGPAPLHDAFRVDKAGSPTQERVVRAIEILQKYDVDFNVLCCVHASNGGYPLDVYRYFRDEIGARFIQFIPIVERNLVRESNDSSQVSARSIDSDVYGDFLAQIFDDWVNHDVGRIYVQIFDVTLSAWSGYPPGLCIFNETCGQALALEHNGDLYACDHYVEPGYWLGNIMQQDIGDLARSASQAHFGDLKKASLPQTCRECRVRFICNGGCPKDRYLSTATGEPGLNYLCAGYYKFFTHSAEPMQVMASLLKMHLPAAGIMGIRSQKSTQVLAPEVRSTRRHRHKRSR